MQEELAGKLGDARKLVQKGCELCPTSEDVWLESARLTSPDNAKAVLARGVSANPNSVKLWMRARSGFCLPLLQCQVCSQAWQLLKPLAVDCKNQKCARPAFAFFKIQGLVK